MRVMIHGCIKRKDYIFEFLKPSLLNQGFKEDDIFVYLDEKMIGVRKAYI